MSPLRLRVWDGSESKWVGRGGSSVIEEGGGSGSPWTQPQAKLAGAQSLGATSYAIPTDGRPVYYVNPTSGNDSNNGSLNSPKRTVAATITAFKSQGTASAPVTIIMRGGIYHEGGISPGNGYYLRLQAYPGEVVWFDGSQSLTGTWTNNGNGTWTHAYTAPAIPALGNDHLAGDQNALLPDMCLINGTQLYQVADNATPSSGQFSVNRTNNTVTIATNPSSNDVRMSTIAMLTQSGSRMDLLGIGIRRYRCVGNTLHTALYYGGTSQDLIIENCVFEQLGRNGICVSKSNNRISMCTFREVGQTAILGSASDYLMLEQCMITNTNTGKWQPQPTSGAIKVTAARGSTYRYNHMTHSHNGNQLWLDVSCTQVSIYNNYIDGTDIGGTTYTEAGIVYEECDGGVWGGVQQESIIAGNTILNCHKSIVINASGNVLVANNTIHAKWTASNTAQAILVLQDRDDNHGQQVPVANCHWWTVGVRLINNRILSQANGWQFLAYDSQGEVPRPRAIALGLGSASGQLRGGDMLKQVAGNWFALASGSTASGSIMATIGRYDGVRTNINTPAALRASNPDYALSSTNIGLNYQGSGELTATDHETARPLEEATASLLEIPEGIQYVGNPLRDPVVRDEGYDIIVPIIQSNMRGAATDFTTADATYPSDVYMWNHTTQTIVQATEPQSNPDNGGGMGASNTFVRDWAAQRLQPGRRILIVNVARGGTGFTTPSTNTTGGTGLHWRFDLTNDANNLARRAVDTIQEALVAAGPGSRIVAFTANHGSTDGTNNTPKATFKTYLTAWIPWLRNQLGAEGVPYVMMQMRPDLVANETRHRIVDEAQREVAQELPYVGYAYSPNTSEFYRTDSVHFNAAGVREIGHRLFDSLTQLGF